jgi:putative copper export protein
MQNIFIASIVRSIHNIFTSIWIGGMAAILFSFMPAIRQSVEDKPMQNRITQTMIKYQSRWVYVGIFVLAVTGILMARLSGNVSRPFDFSNPYAAVLSFKHILVIIVSLIAILRSQMSKRKPKAMKPGQNKLGNYLLAVNTVLGFAILILSSINAIMQ